MKSKDIVYTLGYVALFSIALYFVFGLLKISGQGLSSMGLTDDIIEGMTDKAKEKSMGKIDKIIEKKQKELEKMQEDFDPDEFSDKISELMAIEKKLARHKFIEILAKDGPSSAMQAIQASATYHPLGALSMAIDPENILNDSSGGSSMF
jgi:hypothetical protein